MSIDISKIMDEELEEGELTNSSSEDNDDNDDDDITPLLPEKLESLSKILVVGDERANYIKLNAFAPSTKIDKVIKSLANFSKICDLIDKNIKKNYDVIVVFAFHWDMAYLQYDNDYKVSFMAVDGKCDLDIFSHTVKFQHESWQDSHPNTQIVWTIPNPPDFYAYNISFVKNDNNKNYCNKSKDCTSSELYLRKVRYFRKKFDDLKIPCISLTNVVFQPNENINFLNKNRLIEGLFLTSALAKRFNHHLIDFLNKSKPRPHFEKSLQNDNAVKSNERKYMTNIFKDSVKKLQDLYNIHLCNCDFYRNSHRSHPMFEIEMTTFLKHYNSNPLKFSIDNMENDLLNKQWEVYWVKRIEQLFDEEWIVRKNLFIASLKKENPNEVFPPHSNWETFFLKNNMDENTKYNSRTLEKEKSETRSTSSVEKEKGQMRSTSRKKSKLKLDSNERKIIIIEDNPGPYKEEMDELDPQILIQFSTEKKRATRSKPSTKNSKVEGSENATDCEMVDLTEKLNDPDIWQELGALHNELTSLMDDGKNKPEDNLVSSSKEETIESISKKDENALVISTLRMLHRLSNRLGPLGTFISAVYDSAAEQYKKGEDLTYILNDENKNFLSIAHNKLEKMAQIPTISEIQKSIYSETLRKLNLLITKFNIKKNVLFDVDIYNIAEKTIGYNTADMVSFIENVLLYNGIVGQKDLNVMRIIVAVKHAQVKMINN